MIKLTPPMGWNSWNTFGENINEKMIFETADVMAESGLRDKGYEYLVIDDCWSYANAMKTTVLCRIREISARYESRCRLRSFQRAEIRYVFLRRKHDVCRLPWKL